MECPGMRRRWAVAPRWLSTSRRQSRRPVDRSNAPPWTGRPRQEYVRPMMAFFRQNAIALLALFVALGGTGAYAANTIMSGDIVDGQVKTADLGTGAVVSSKI